MMFRRVANVAQRAFSTTQAPASSAASLRALAQKEYTANKAAVDAHFDSVLRNNKVVAFLEGTVDHPVTASSLNVVKMLTQVQATPVVAVDVLEHPAILGYALSKSKAASIPVVFKESQFLGDHDDLLSQFSAGKLVAIIGKEGAAPISTI